MAKHNRSARLQECTTMRRLPPNALYSAAVGLATAIGLLLLGLAGGSFDVVPRQTSGLILWWIVLVGAALGLRTPARPSIAGITATALGAGIALWAAVGVGASISQERSVVEVGRAITHLAPVVLVGWVMPRQYWRSVVVGVALGGTVVCFAALGERLSPGLLVETRTIVFTNTASRLAAPLGYWNALGSWGVLTLLLLLSISAHARRPLHRAAALAPVGVVALVIYLTYSRSAIAAGLVGVLVLLALARNRWTVGAHLSAAILSSAPAILVARAQPDIADASGADGAGAVVAALLLGAALASLLGMLSSRVDLDRLRLPAQLAHRLTVSLAVATTGAVLVLGATRGTELWDRFSTNETQAQGAAPTARFTMINNGSRVQQWKVAWSSWEQHRWRGTGAGTFELTYNRAGKDTQFVRDAHNSFLETLSEQGVVGLGLLLGFVGAICAVVTQALRRAVSDSDRGLVAGAAAALAAFGLGTSVDWFWELTALALMAMTLVGALIAASSAPMKQGQQTLASVPLRLGMASLALLSVAALLPGLVGTSQVRQSQRDVERGDLVSARAAADRSIETMPWASSPFLQRALVDEQAGELASARRAIRLAVTRDPYDWRLPLVLARIEATDGRPQAALDAYRSAKALRPRGQFFR